MARSPGTRVRNNVGGLGQSAPNPVLSTLRYFRHEYEVLIRDGATDESRVGAEVGSPLNAGQAQLAAAPGQLPARVGPCPDPQQGG
jgi:hypothetical protein